MQLTNKQTSKIWKRVLKLYGVQPVKLSKWYHSFKRKRIKSMLKAYGFKRLADLLDSQIMFIQLGKRKYLSLPNGAIAKTNERKIALLAHGMSHAEQCHNHGMPHAEQCHNHGSLGFYIYYLTNQLQRAEWEADAEYNEMRVYEYLTGGRIVLPNLDAGWERIYQADCNDAKEHFRSVKNSSNVYKLVCEVVDKVVG